MKKNGLGLLMANLLCQSLSYVATAAVTPNSDPALAVFSADQLGRAVQGPLWTPTQSEANSARSALLELVKKKGRPTGDAKLPDDIRIWRAVEEDKVYANFDRYSLQFAGVHPPQKNILINGYCLGGQSDKWVSVADGGACFFQAYYDPETNSITALGTNGR